MTDEPLPRFKVNFGGSDAIREPIDIDAEEFVGVKGFKAKGKRVSNWTIDSVEQLEPRMPQESIDEDQEDAEETPTEGIEENLDPDAGKSQSQVIDEITGQLSLFQDEDDN